MYSMECHPPITVLDPLSLHFSTNSDPSRTSPSHHCITTCVKNLQVQTKRTMGTVRLQKNRKKGGANTFVAFWDTNGVPASSTESSVCYLVLKYHQHTVLILLYFFSECCVTTAKTTVCHLLTFLYLCFGVHCRAQEVKDQPCVFIAVYCDPALPP